MKPATIVGILLIVLGVIGFAMGGIGLTEHKRESLGPLHFSHSVHQSIPLSPALSALALVGGVVLVAVGARSR